MSYKTRSNYKLNSDVCSDKCRCEMCRREQKGFYTPKNQLDNWQSRIQAEAEQRRGK